MPVVPRSCSTRHPRHPPQGLENPQALLSLRLSGICLSMCKWPQPSFCQTFKVLGKSKDEEASSPQWPPTLGQGFGLPPSAALDLPAGNKAAGPQGRLPFWLTRPAREFLPPVQRHSQDPCPNGHQRTKREMLLSV